MSEYRAEAFFGPDGVMAHAFDGFEYRAQQEEMSQVVGDVIENDERAVIEAGTGTGKTLAYLMPIAAKGVKAVVSTATKALQGQLVNSDIPKVTAAGLEVHARVLKGKNNYICKRKYVRAVEQRPAWAQSNWKLWREIRAWVSENEDFLDKAGFHQLGENDPAWNDIVSTSNNCWGKDCPYKNQCNAKLARAAACSADILIVNHHLFFADLSLKEAGGKGIFPQPDVVIFDEAHRLEDAATGFFSTTVTWARCKHLIKSIRSNFHTSSNRLKRSVDDFRGKAKTFFNILNRAAEEEAGLGSAPWVELFNAMEPHLEKLTKSLKALAASIANESEDHVKLFDPTSSAGATISRLKSRSYTLLGDFEHAARDIIGEGPDKFVRYVQHGKFGARLISSPVHPGEVLEYSMLPLYPAMVMTSATIAIGDDFGHFRSRVGLDDPDEAYDYIFESPFDYNEQALIYVPSADRIPNPNSKDFVPLIGEDILKLVHGAGGRAFVLCTSFKNMNGLHKALKSRIPYQVLRQGEISKDEIVRRFKAEPSVLFATASFWEGVDIPGEALSLVVIDKLPFAVFTDPLVKARMRLIEDEGGNPFMEYQVPVAAIALKQGFGRLVRRRDDYGAVAIMDTRLQNARYASVLWAALPDCAVCEDVEDVKEWFDIV